MDKEKLKALIDRDLKEGRLPFIYAAEIERLLAEIEELKRERDALRGLPADWERVMIDRAAALQKERDDLAAWAEQITKYLRLIEQEDRHDMSGRSNFRSYVERIYKKALSLPSPAAPRG